MIKFIYYKEQIFTKKILFISSSFYLIDHYFFIKYTLPYKNKNINTKEYISIIIAKKRFSIYNYYIFIKYIKNDRNTNILNTSILISDKIE